MAEARSADEPVLTRRCVIMKVQDFTTENYLEAQGQGAAAILILLPKNISSISHETVQVKTGEAAKKAESEYDNFSKVLGDCLLKYYFTYHTIAKAIESKQDRKQA